MKSTLNKIFVVVAVIILFGSCTDLDLVPIDDDAETTLNFFDSPEAFEQALAKIYGGLYLTGQDGPAGAADVSGDEGQSGYIRTLYQAQVYSTDEAFVGSNFNDENIRDFQNHQWTANTSPMGQLFARFYFQITNCNAFIPVASASSDATVQGYAAEARFLRALSYWHALDLFRNIPFVTEEDGVGAFLPQQGTPQEVFNYIETELLAIEDLLPDPGDVTYYPRATKGAVQMLLAKLYLNAEVYLGSGNDRYDDALTYTQRVIAHSAYGLEGNYDHLFLADNQDSREFIFAVAQDGTNGQSFGGGAFIVNAAVGGSMNSADFGVGGWGGTRTTRTFVEKFTDDVIDGSFDEDAAVDSRANFFTTGHTLEIEDLATFTSGYAITKFKNVDRDGNPGANNQFVDIDWPIFRLADAYLMYAELFLRNASGADGTVALGYVNDLRERAYGNTSGNILLSDLSLDFIIDERARELYWESHRRTDLVRFGLFSGGSYLWPLKGGDGNLTQGVPTGAERDYYPLPSDAINSNPNLEQNDGY